MAEQKTANGGSQVMEERIVAAKFDSSDFEKGVDRTVKKLDELKKSLNLKDTGKSITEIGDKTKEATESASKSLEKLTDRFTTFSGMVKQKLLSGIADQVVNAFFRMERAVLSFAKSMTFDQISNGLGKYEEALTSVRMIVNSYKTVKNEITGVNEKIHYTQEEAYASIHTLQKYADETSYSMSQMTDAMSKMVAAGVDMDTATKNVQGIANACAAAGVNAQEASRAFYNLSQAYSSGALKYTDYRSLELLNMTNENFQDQLLAAGVASGTLKEVKGKNGTVQYKTQKSKTNGKVTAGKTFTRQGLTDSLRYGWADNNVMNQLFGSNFYVDVQDFLAAEDQYDEKEWKNFNGQQKTEARKKYLASLKDLDAIETYINKLGDKNVTKEILKSKTTSEEKEEYLKSLSDQADELNEVARKYAKVDDTDIKNYLNGLEDDDEHKVHYKELKTDKERKEYLKQLKNDETFIKDVKGKAIGYDEAAVKSYIEALDDSDERKKKYMDMDEKQRKQYIKDLITEAEGLGKISKKYSDITIQSFLAAREARNLSDVINAVGDYVSSKWTKVFENLIGTLEDASDFFTELSEGGIASIFTDFADWAAAVSDTFAETDGSKAFRDIITEIDSALGNLFGIFNDLSPETSEFGWTLSVIASKISVTVQEFNTWTERVRYWFKEVERAETIKTIFANLSGVFTIGARLITTAFGTIGKALEVVAPILDAVFVALSEITKPIGELGSLENNEPFTKLSEAIDNFFRVISPVSEGLAEPIKVIGGFLGTIGEFFLQGAIDTLVANITLLGDTIAFFLELFAGPSDVLNEEGKKIGEVYDKGSKQAEEGRGVIQGIITDVNNLKNTLSSALGTVSGFFDNLFIDLRKIFNLKQEEGADVQDGGLFANVKNFFDTNEFIKKAEEWLANAKTDIVTWFDNAVKSMQTWIGNLPKTIDDFFSSVFSNTSKETENGNDESVKESAEGAISPFKTWLSEVRTNFDGWFEQAKVDIKTWIKDVPNKLNQFFTGFLYQEDTSDAGKYVKEHYGKTAYVETPLKKWLESVVESVSNFVANIPGYLLKAIGKIGDIFVFVVDALFGAAEETNDTKKNPKNERSAATVANNWGTTFVEKIKDAIKSIPEQVTTFIAEMKGRFKKALGTIKTWFKESETGKAITEFGQSIIAGIKKFILNLPTTIKNLIKSIGSTGRNIISWVKELFGNGDVGDEIQNELEKEVKGISLGSILSSIADIGVTIANEVLSLFTGTDDLESNINWFISTVIGFITSIPGRLWDEAQRIGTSISEVWEYIMGQLTSDGDGDKSKGASNAEEFAKKHPVLKQTIDAAITWIQGIPDRFQEAYRGLSSRINKVWSDIETIVGRNDRLAEINELLNDAGDDLRSDDKRALEEEKTRLEADTDFEKNHPIIAGLVSSAVQWINNLPDTLTDAWETAKETISTFWKGFTAFWNKSDRTRSEIISDMRHYDPGSEQYKALEEELDTLHKAEDFEKAHPQLASWVNTARDWISSIPETLDGVWQTASTGITKVWKDFTDFWNKSDRLAEINELLNDAGDDLRSDDKRALEEEKTRLEADTDFEKNHPKLAWIITSARGWIRDIPKNLDSVFQQFQSDWDEFWTTFNNFWNKDPGSKEETDFERRYPVLSGIVTSIRTWIENLPEELTKTFDSVKGDLQKFFDAFGEYWDTLNKKSAKQNELNNLNPKDSNYEEQKAALEAEIAGLDADINKTGLATNHPFLASALESLHGWLTSIPDTVATAFTSATESLKNFWKDLVDAFNGNNLDADTTAESETLGQKIKNKIITFFVNIPTYIAEGINAALELIQKAFDGLSNLFNGPSADNLQPEEIAQGLGQSMEKLSEATEETLKEAEKNVGDNLDKDSETPKEGFLSGITKIGETLWSIITVTIPAFITSGFAWVGRNVKSWFDLPEDASFIDLAVTVGGRIKEAIEGSTIVTKISEAFDNIKNNWKETWGPHLDAIFDGWIAANEDPENSNIITGFKANLGLIGKTITGLIDDLFADKPVEESSGIGVNPMDIATNSVSVDKIDEAEIDKKFSLTEVFTRIGIAIQNACGLVIPFVIKGVTDTIQNIGKVLATIGDLITGKQNIDDVLTSIFGEDAAKNIKEALTKFLDSIKTFFLETIPGFFTNTIGAVFADGPNIIDTALGAIGTLFSGAKAEGDDASEEGDQAAESVEKVQSNVVTVLDRIKGIIDTIAAGGDLYMILGIGFLVVNVLHAVRDVFSITDELEGAASIVKWTGITAAILGIVSMVGYMIYLASVDEDGKKLERVKDTLDHLKDSMLEIGKVLVAISAINLVKSGLEFGTAKAESKGLLSQLSDANGPGFWDMITNGAASGISNFITLLGAGAGIGTGAQLAVNGVSGALNGVVDMWSDIGLTLNSFMANLEPAIERITGLGDKIEKAKESLGKVTEIFDVLKRILGYDPTGVTQDRDTAEPGQKQQDFMYDADHNIDGWIRFTQWGRKDINTIISMLDSVASIISAIAIAIDKMAVIDNPEDQLSKLSELIYVGGDFEKLVGNLFEVFEFTFTTHYGGDMTNFESMSESIQSFGTALGVFVQALQSLTPENVNELDQVLGLFGKIAGVSEDVGAKASVFEVLFKGTDSDLTKAGRAMASFAAHMIDFANYIVTIAGIRRGSETKDEQDFDAVLTLIGDVLQKCGEVSVRYKSGDTNAIESLATDLSNSIDALTTFVTSVNENFPEDVNIAKLNNISSITGSMNTLAYNLTALNAKKDLLKEPFKAESFDKVVSSMDGFTTFIGSFNTKIPDNLDMSKVETVSKAISAMIDLGNGLVSMEGKDYSELESLFNSGLIDGIINILDNAENIDKLHAAGTSMAALLAEGIQSAFDSGEDIYTPTIRPIFDDESIKTQMASLFGTENTAEFNISTGFTEAVRQAFGGSETLTNLNTAVGEIRDDVRNNLSDINNQMDSLRTEIGELQNAFDGISMYLDSGELVGAIGARMHEYIDSRIDLYVRHVTQ